jgi:iron complex outermembrane receptor protein
MLVLQDGRDLSTALVMRQTWGALAEPIEDLGRIEVIRGPGSALYGPNAYSGVISITTPAARELLGTNVALGGGELGTLRADIRHAGVFLRDRLGYRVNVGYARSDNWVRSRTATDGSDWDEEYATATTIPPTNPGAERMPLIGQTKDSLTGRALGTPDPLVSIYGSARVDHYATNGYTLTIEGGAAQEENPVFTIGTGRSQTPRLLRPWARFAWGRDGNGVSAWYSGLALPQGQIRMASGARLENSERVIHVEARASRRFRENTGRLMMGASVQNNAVNSEGTVLIRSRDDRSDLYYGAFGQLEYSLRSMRVISALRWDESNLLPAQLSPKAALVFSPSVNHSLRLSVNRAFLTPSLTSLFQASPAGPGVQNLTGIENTLRADPTLGPALGAVPIGTLFTHSAAVPESALGNPRLKPQTLTSYETGYKGQLGRRAFLTADLYYAHMLP